MDKYITVKGAKTNNLKNIDASIPRGKITAIVGVSGAGKSSLAFDTIYAEGYMRYIESISPYIRQFLDKIEKPPVEKIDGLPPAISFKQKKPSKNPRSVVATSLDVFDYLRILYSKISGFHCPTCHQKIKKYSIDEIISELLENNEIMNETDKKIDILFPYNGELPFLLNNGYYFHIEDGIKKRIDSQIKNKMIDVLLDSVELQRENKSRLFEALDKSIAFGNGAALVYYKNKKKLFPADLYCMQCDIHYPPPDEHLFSFNNPKGACPHCKGYGLDSADTPCKKCGGSRFNDLARSFKINGKHIADFLSFTIQQAADFMNTLDPTRYTGAISPDALTDIRLRLDFLVETGLTYIQLNRPTATLSRGEFQRINLAFILGSTLSDSLLIMDQPSSDLHPYDYEKLKTFLSRLKENENTLLIIEHNKDIVKHCDYVIELGPLAGENGGQTVFTGDKFDFFSDKPGDDPTLTLTQQYFNRPVTISSKKEKIFKKWLEIKNAHTHNLKNIDVKIPLNTFTTITGVSGAGKTTLLYDELYLKYGDNKTIFIDPGGQHIRPNMIVAGFFDVFASFRDIFASLKESRLQQYTSGHFSFNSPQGQCEHCKGKGSNEIEMQFLPSINLLCAECEGTGFKPDVLKIKYRKWNIREILDLSVDRVIEEASDDLPDPQKKILRNISDNGLGYIKFGQRLKTLSTGELQRIKLLKNVNTEQTGALFLIDEPTFGMHPYDIETVKRLIDKLIARENTVVAAEHNIDLIAHSDYIIELGPKGGEDGGRVVFQGALEEISNEPNSLTGIYLKKNLKNT